MATHESAEVRRAQILQAAMQCFGEKGFHAARMDDIVACSGLSKGAIYWQFDSKEEIFFALFDSYEQAIFAEWEQVDQSDALLAIEREGAIVLERMSETRVLLDTWTEFMRHPRLRERFAGVYAQSRQRLADTISNGVERGQLRPCETDAVAALLTGAIEGLLLQTLVDGEFDAIEAWSQSWPVLAAGLAA